MALPFRKTLFWIHLVVGVVVGIVVAIMSVTGVAIAFEHQVLDWADSEARTVSAPGPGTTRLSLEEMIAKVRDAKPDAQVSGVTVFPSETSATQVALGRAGVVFVNPYTGEVRESSAKGWRSFFQVMVEWHRWLALGGDNRAVGKAITGACNAGFLFLAISGLYLWWPRKWTLKTVRPVLWFRRGLKGKPRDFNWHNVIGFWTLPVLIVLTASGMVISYKWASDFVYTLTGNAPPAQQGPGSAGVKVAPPSEDAVRKDLGSLLAVVQGQAPTWESITYRLPSPPRGAGGNAPGAPRGEGGRRGGKGAEGASREGAESQRRGPDGEGKSDGKVDTVNFNVKVEDGWPYFAATQYALNPFSGEVAKREGYADFNSGRKVRTWLRFLHTGEALGWPGQLIAAIASLGGVFLVWTGFALSWRRFFPKRQPRHTEPVATGASETPV
ncbi:PepSY-associated TM helix domain-containing protein [Myxococcus sp. MISCRS1]|uniref:PepSY-associated TM helix domain-containing protein n=1 Tax=Myxococcus sp. MISCRS1 TaxID=2996786 RepID=UPI00226D4068|nr:PepSY-associated TM helix domain-containing protein [Myxococcus sp. MISCRS1]MCY1003890.1 PepSY-associated TM helix domain-containing protein [Myxococcus sp. MISCRS1]